MTFISKSHESTNKVGDNLGAVIAFGLSQFAQNHSVTIASSNKVAIQYLEKKGIALDSDNNHNIAIADIIIHTITALAMAT